MSNDTTQHTPADVRERVAFEVFAWEHGRRGASAEWIRAQWQGETPKWRAMYFDLADRILGILRTQRGEGEDSRLAPIVRAILERIDRYQAFHDRVGPADLTLPPVARTITEEEIFALRAALSSEAQVEDDVSEFCHLCGEEFDPRESGTVTGPLGQDDGVPRWYRCPRCARAYDAGYQQGQRDPRGDETADPTALRDGAQGEEPVAWICEVQTEDGDWIYMRTLLSRVEVNEWSERFGRPVRVRVRQLYDPPDDAVGSGEGGSNGLE